MGLAIFTFDFGGSGLSDGKYITIGVKETEDLDIIMESL